MFLKDFKYEAVETIPGEGFASIYIDVAIYIFVKPSPGTTGNRPRDGFTSIYIGTFLCMGDA